MLVGEAGVSIRVSGRRRSRQEVEGDLRREGDLVALAGGCVYTPQLSSVAEVDGAVGDAKRRSRHRIRKLRWINARALAAVLDFLRGTFRPAQQARHRLVSAAPTQRQISQSFTLRKKVLQWRRDLVESEVEAAGIDADPVRHAFNHERGRRRARLGRHCEPAHGGLLFALELDLRPDRATVGEKRDGPRKAGFRQHRDLAVRDADPSNLAPEPFRDDKPVIARGSEQLIAEKGNALAVGRPCRPVGPEFVG